MDRVLEGDGGAKKSHKPPHLCSALKKSPMCVMKQMKKNKTLVVLCHEEYIYNMDVGRSRLSVTVAKNQGKQDNSCRVY